MARTVLWLASGNAHKAAEFQALAASSGLPVDIRGAREAGGMPEVAEDTGTFEGNARKKARALHAKTGGWVLADDSGLCVEALGGAPGVESAYYAGAAGDAAANRRKLREALAGVPAERRRAHFHCLLLLLDPAGGERRFEGRCDGVILESERGAGGFGYDPLFLPDGHALSLAELSAGEKNRISHRGRAWQRLADWLVSTVRNA